jgi:transposase
MPWKGVTVSEERQRFLEDHKLSYYSVSELAERFGISRRTAHPGLTSREGKWIERFDRQGLVGFHEPIRRPLSSPWQTQPAVVEELEGLRGGLCLPTCPGSPTKHVADPRTPCLRHPPSGTRSAPVR